MQYRLAKYKIKKGALPKAELFIRTVNERRSEVNEILDMSGIVMDCSFLERGDQECFLYIFLKAMDIQVAKDLLEKSNSSIYKFIEQMASEFIEGASHLETAAIFDRNSENSNARKA